MERETEFRCQLVAGDAEMPIDCISLGRATALIDNYANRHWSYVVTPNLHHLVTLRKKPILAEIYRNAWLSLPDGWPIARMASARTGQHVARVAGSDLMESVLNLHGHGRPLVLAGGEPGPPLDALKQRALGAGWNVQYEPVPRAELHDIELRAKLLERLALKGNRGLVVLGVGAPRQEMLAQELAATDGTGGIVLCLGMSINFSAGSTRRAPVMVRRLNLEWIYRAFQEPRRLIRRYAEDAISYIPIMVQNKRGKH